MSEYTKQQLEQAIRKEDLRQVTEILAHEPKMINETSEDGILLALVAAGTGNLELVQLIVEYSMASMDITDGNHRNILHYGAASGNTELCRYLVERVGMSPDTGDRSLVTPLDIAHQAGNQELEAYFCHVLGAPLEEMYRNPIRTGMYPDPSIVRVGEDYYMVNSTFVFFPCIPISHSRDLINWEIIGHAITNPEWAGLDELEGGRGYWAPDISYDNGTFYVTATYRMNDDKTVYRKQIVVSSDKPQGPYSEPAFIDEDGIDPSLFHENGRHYMILNRGARILELSPDCKRQISPAKLLYYGSNKRAPEGSHLLKKDGWYYLFQAEGGTGIGHRITVSRSRELMGIYEPCPYNPIMRQHDRKAGIQRCGHGKPVNTQNGEWYIPYLCGRLVEDSYTVLGRETALDPITWTPDGWPLVNRLKGPSVIQKRPNLPFSEKKEADEHGKTERFDRGEFSKEWLSPRPMKPDAVRFDGGFLWLTSNREPLSSRDAHNILLKRQTDFCFTAWTKAKLAEVQGEYGLICYYDENTWVSCGVSSINKGEQPGEWIVTVTVREHIGHEDIVHEPTVLKTGSDQLTISVETEYLKRTFLLSDGQGNCAAAAALERVTYLSDEGICMGKRFTGAMVGIYAYSPCESFEAGFSEFGYRKQG